MTLCFILSSYWMVLMGRSHYLEFTYITNPGAAWSMLSDYPMLLTILAGVALFAIFLFRSQLELNKKLPQVIFGIICGGIAGNLSDRLFREPAAVVDFIDVYIPIVNYDYPVFNIADSGIFVGAFGYLILGLLESKKAKEMKSRNAPFLLRRTSLFDIERLLSHFFDFCSCLQCNLC